MGMRWLLIRWSGGRCALVFSLVSSLLFLVRQWVCASGFSFYRREAFRLKEVHRHSTSSIIFLYYCLDCWTAVLPSIIVRPHARLSDLACAPTGSESPPVFFQSGFFPERCRARFLFFFRAALLVHVVCVFFFPERCLVGTCGPAWVNHPHNLRLATKQKAPVKERIK